MRYIFGFLDKWLSVFFLLILIFFFWGLSKCSDNESVKIEEQKAELPLINPDGSVNIKINESFQHPESGLIIGFDNGAGNLYNVSLPKSGTSMEVLFIGNSFDFEDKNGNKYKCTLLAYNKTLEVATIAIKKEQAVGKNEYEYEVQSMPNEYIHYILEGEAFLDDKFGTDLRVTNCIINFENKSITADFFVDNYGNGGSGTELFLNEKLEYSYNNHFYILKVIKILPPLENEYNSDFESNFRLIKINGKEIKLQNDGKGFAILKITKLKNEGKEDIYEEGQDIGGSVKSMFDSTYFK